jgi:23S rRNA (uridine2552-2'-O)-methyltransferase
MEPIEGVHSCRATSARTRCWRSLQAALGGRPVDVVVSDMAPNLSGVESVDAARISHLVELAVDFAGQHMKPEGALVVKLFPRQRLQRAGQAVQAAFGGQADQAQGPRARSPETFLVGISLKQAA